MPLHGLRVAEDWHFKFNPPQAFIRLQQLQFKTQDKRSILREHSLNPKLTNATARSFAFNLLKFCRNLEIKDCSYLLLNLFSLVLTTLTGFDNLGHLATANRVLFVRTSTFYSVSCGKIPNDSVERVPVKQGHKRKKVLLLFHDLNCFPVTA